MLSITGSFKLPIKALSLHRVSYLSSLSSSSIEGIPQLPPVHATKAPQDAISISLASSKDEYKEKISSISEELSSILKSMDVLKYKPGRFTPLTPTSFVFSTKLPKPNDSGCTPLPTFPLLSHLKSNNTYALVDEVRGGEGAKEGWSEATAKAPYRLST